MADTETVLVLETDCENIIYIETIQTIFSDDGNVTLLEYMTFSQLPQEYAEPIFNALDNNDDGILPDSFMQDYFAMLDKNGAYAFWFRVNL